MKNSAAIKIFLVSCAVGLVGGFGLLAALWTVQSAGGVQLKLMPSGGIFTVGQDFAVQILLNTDGKPIDALEVYLTYDSTLLQVKDSDAGEPGIQITDARLLTQTIDNKVPSADRIIFTQAMRSGKTYRNSADTRLATVQFTALREGSATVAFAFTSGVTTDTNVASAGNDILTKVENGSYTLVAAAPPPPPLPVGTCDVTESCVASTLDTNIYLISYNEDAGEPTKAIFDELLNNWRFNVNVGSFRNCRGNPAKACSSDLDCPAGDQCLNTHDKIRRDAVRFGQLQDLRLVLRQAQQRRGGTLPLWDATRREFSGGTFVPGQSFSAWPSWRQTFAQQLGATPPVDPLNTFVGCRTPYDETTCWDERALKFGCPSQAYVYGYQVNKTAQGKDYQLYTSFEYPSDKGGWSDPRLNIPELSACFNFFALGIGDGDADGVRDSNDNCVGKLNPYECVGGTALPEKTYCPGQDAAKCTGGSTCQQPDGDTDKLGDACDPCPNSKENDQDHDGVCENGQDNPQHSFRPDNCPTTANADQRDADADTVGDACDGICAADLDRDGVCDETDNCPTVFNPDQFNTDSTTDSGDGQVWPNGRQWGDACDLCTDVDDDGWGAGLPAESCRVDNCRLEANPHQEDFDHDGQGYVCDSCIDSDNDQLTDQLISNSGFEEGLNGWTLFTSAGASLRQATDYARLQEKFPSGKHDKVYRGIHSAEIANVSAGPAALRTVANPRFVPTSPDYGVRYFLEARVKLADTSRLQLRPIRGCSNDQATATQNGLEHRADCQAKNFLLVMPRPMALQAVGDGWYALRREFVADSTLANDPIIFELAVEAGSGSVYVDDFMVGFQCATCVESCPRAGWPRLGYDRGEQLYRPLDNCRVLNNPTRCVSTGTICTFDGNCTGSDVCQQPDYDEDNVGDSCDRCTDRDGDRIGNAGYTVSGCAGSFFKTDNCPATPNADQADYDQDANVCNFSLSLPYITTSSDARCNYDQQFPLGKQCQFCGGDACDLDADGDWCYNWERLKNQPGHDANLSLHGGVALESLPAPNYTLYREEGYALYQTHDEVNWRSYSRDVDVDGIADDCDAQACGNRVIENARRAVPLATLDGLTEVWVREGDGVGWHEFSFDRGDAKLVQMISEVKADEVLKDGTKRHTMCDYASGHDTDPKCYDIYFSDADSSLNPNGGYLTITAWRKSFIRGSTSHNIDAVRLFFSGSKQPLYADKVTHVELGELEAGEDPLPTKALGQEDNVATRLGDLKASITLGFATDSVVNQCANVVTGAQTCEECDANNFSVGSRCDNPYAAGTRVTYRQLYPLQPVTPVLFLAHFNQTLDAFSGSGSPVGAMSAPLQYAEGLADGSVDETSQPVQLGQSLKFGTGDSLVYPAGSLYQAGGRTASVWVNVRQEVKDLSLFGGSPIPLRTSWPAHSWHHLALTWDTLGVAGGQITFDNVQLYGDGQLIPSQPSFTFQASAFMAFDIRQFLTAFGLGSFEVQLDELEFRSEKLDATTIAARFTAVSNQCLGPAVVSHDRYMVENFCAACNNLRCQASVVRTCLPITLADQLKQCFDIQKKELERKRQEWQAKPENRTDFLWVLDNLKKAGIVRKMVAIGGVEKSAGVTFAIGENFSNAGVVAPNPKVVGNYGDFSVFIDDAMPGKPAHEFSHVWVPFEDSDGSSGSDDGAIREIKLKSDLTSEIERECFLGVESEDSGVIGSTVDTRGNSWSLFATRRIVLMQYQKSSGQGCNTTEPNNAVSVFRLDVGGEDIHAMEVDRENNLWLVRENTTVKVNLDWIYANVTRGVQTGNNKQVSMVKVAIKGNTCVVTAKNLDGKAIPGPGPCYSFSTPDAGEIAIDANNSAWVAKYTDTSNIVYFIRDGEPVPIEIEISQKYFKPRYLTVDIGNNVWVTVEKDKDNNDVSRVLQLGTKPLVIITPPGPSIYGIAADSLGYLWVMHKNGDGTLNNLAELSRWRVSDGSGPDTHEIQASAFKSNKKKNWTRSAIRTGLSPRIISGWLGLTEKAAGGGSVYGCEVATNFTAVATAAVNWQNRWGKIFYDVQPATPGVTASVSVASDLALVGTQWIAVSDFNNRVGRAPLISLSQAARGEKGEIVGKYLRMRFEIPTSVQSIPEITNLRITCRGDLGRNVCRAP